jgi:CHAT domain-containing protein
MKTRSWRLLKAWANGNSEQIGAVSATTRTIFDFNPDCRVRVLTFDGREVGACDVPAVVRSILVAPNGLDLCVLIEGPDGLTPQVLVSDPQAQTLTVATDFDLPSSVRDAGWTTTGELFCVGLSGVVPWTSVSKRGASRVARTLPERPGAETVWCWEEGEGLTLSCRDEVAPWSLHLVAVASTDLGVRGSGRTVAVSYVRRVVTTASEMITHALMDEVTMVDLTDGWSTPVTVGSARAIAYRHGCLALLKKGEIQCVRVAEGAAAHWGDPLAWWGVKSMALDADFSSQFVAVATDDETRVYALTDLDILRLDDSSPAARSVALQEIHERGLVEAVPALARLAERTDDDDERGHVLFTLCRLAGSTALKAALALVGRYPAKATVAVEGCRLRTDEELGGCLRDAVASGRANLIKGALSVVAARSEVQVGTELVTSLSHRDPGVRGAAADLLTDRVVPGTLPALLKCLADDDHEVVRSALAALLTATSRVRQASEADERALDAYAAAVLRTGRVAVAAAEQPEGAGLAEGLTTQLIVEPRDHTLNALQALAHSARQPLGISLAWELSQRPETSIDRSARAFLMLARDLLGDTGAPELRWRVHQWLGYVAEADNHWREAEKHFADAERVIDRLWAQLLGEPDDRFFFRDKAALYESALLCRLRLGQTAAALDTLERYKTRYLGDLIARRHSSPRQELTAIDQQFWRAAGERRAAAITFGVAESASSANFEIVGVEVITGEDEQPTVPVLPVRLADALRDHVNGNDLWLVSIARDTWAVIGLLGSDDLSDLDDIARNALLALDGLLRDSRDRDVDLWRAEADEPFRDLADTIYAWREGQPGWALREYRRLIGDVGDVPDAQVTQLIEVLLEATSYVSGREPVLAIADVNEDMAEIWRDARGRSQPMFIAGRAVASTDQGSAGTARSALELAESQRWDYVARIARGEAAGTREAADLLRSRPDTAILEFAVTGDGTVIFVLADGASLDEQPLPSLAGWSGCAAYTVAGVTTQTLAARVEEWRRGHSSIRNDQGATFRANLDTAGRWLYDSLFARVRPSLETLRISRLIVVPHRGLHLLPITAWRSPKGRYVADDFEVTFAPSLTLLDICRQHRKVGGGTPGAYLDPQGNLPRSRLDIGSFGRGLRREQVFVGKDATTSNLRAHARGTSPLHYAGHADFNWSDPLKSEIRLADEQLTLGDMFDVAIELLPGGEVVLAACETTLTDPTDAADEFLVLASGFLFGGAGSVVATLWPVPDRAGGLLVAAYYEARELGLPAAAALRKAQAKLRKGGRSEVLKLLKGFEQVERFGLVSPALRSAVRDDARRPRQEFSRRYSDPMYWAAFTIMSGLD